MNDLPVTAMSCINHPQRQTMLRCSRCDNPICPSCAVLTPTGYRCQSCVRSQQKVFETAKGYDYPLAFVIAGGLSLLGSYAASFLGFFTIFVAPVAGVIIAEAVRTVVHRRRSKRLFQTAVVAAVLGSLPMLFVNLAGLLLFSAGGLGSLFALLPLIWQAVYTFLVASSTYYRLSGIKIR